MGSNKRTLSVPFKEFMAFGFQSSRILTLNPFTDRITLVNRSLNPPACQLSLHQGFGIHSSGSVPFEVGKAGTHIYYSLNSLKGVI